MRSSVRKLEDERGATLALVAVSLAAILAMGAVTVDLGMLMKMRTDAQRVADAAALAGASAFLTPDPLFDPDTAISRALEYAARNYVGGRFVDTTGGVDSAGWWKTKEAVVKVEAGNQVVRVAIRRPAVGTFFAHLLDTATTTVSAYAVGGALDASGSGCVMPFAIPDLWRENNPAEDVNGDLTPFPDEQWTFDPATDFYQPYNPSVVDPLQTGYGSDWRSAFGDYGAVLRLRPQPAVGGPTARDFTPWTFGGDDPEDADDVADRILGCDPRNVTLGTSGQTVNFQNGAAVINALKDLIVQNPDPSQRVLKIPLYNPMQTFGLADGHPIAFNNIGLFALDQVEGDTVVVGRFLYYAAGASTMGVTGPLVKTIRLVK
ncbi:MAG: pilus assembly protein TadG-related protein [Gemmatimonadales bacterium]